MHFVLKSGKQIVIVRKLWGGLFILRTISMQHPLKECVMVALVDRKCRSHATAFCVIIHSRWFNSLHTSLLYIVSKLGVAKHRHLQMVLDYYRFVFYFFLSRVHRVKWMLNKQQFCRYDYTHLGGISENGKKKRLWRKNRAIDPKTGCIGVDLNRNWGYEWGGQGTSNDPCDDP